MYINSFSFKTFYFSTGRVLPQCLSTSLAFIDVDGKMSNESNHFEAGHNFCIYLACNLLNIIKTPIVAIVDFVKLLYKNKIECRQISILTPYRRQIDTLTSVFGTFKIFKFLKQSSVLKIVFFSFLLFRIEKNCITS
jgi:hypothetical protein